MANDSTFGLCAYIWTKDMARGMRFANEIAGGKRVVKQCSYHWRPNYPDRLQGEAASGKKILCMVLLEYTNLQAGACRFATTEII